MPSMTFTLTLHENGTWTLTSSPPSAPTPTPSPNSLPSYGAWWTFFNDHNPSSADRDTRDKFATMWASEAVKFLAQRG